MKKNVACPECGAVAGGVGAMTLCAKCLLKNTMGADSRRPAETGERRASESFPETRFEKLGLLGEGGSGSVFRAIDRTTDEEVAVKVFKPGLAGFAFRAQLERDTLGSLSHPKLVSFRAEGTTESGRRFIAMELVDGMTLGAFLAASGGRISARRAVSICRQVLEGVSALHHAGFVHRDLKPANIFIDSDESVAVGDFGLAKRFADPTGSASFETEKSDKFGGFDLDATDSRYLVGTPGYVAPERWENPLAIDPRGDIFSVGVILHLLSTGRMPGASLQISANPDVPEELGTVLGRALQTDPDSRFQSAEDFLGALGDCETEELQGGGRGECPAFVLSGSRTADLPGDFADRIALPLTGDHVARLRDAIDTVESTSSRDLAARTMEALRTMMPTTVITVDAVDIKTGDLRHLCSDAPAPSEQNAGEVFASLGMQNPSIAYLATHGPTDEILRISDFQSWREFRETGYFAEVSRDFFFRDQAGFAFVCGGEMITVAAFRDAFFTIEEAALLRAWRETVKKTFEACVGSSPAGVIPSGLRA